MKHRLIAAGLAAMLLTMLAGASPAAALTAARCDEGHWPATVQGKPVSFEPGGAAASPGGSSHRTTSGSSASSATKEPIG